MYSLILSDTAWKSSTLSRLSKIEILFTELSAAKKEKQKKGGRKIKKNSTDGSTAGTYPVLGMHVIFISMRRILGAMFENATNK